MDPCSQQQASHTGGRAAQRAGRGLRRKTGWVIACLLPLLAVGVPLMAEGPLGGAPTTIVQPGILPQITILFFLSLLPFAVMLLTSFTKIAVVLGLLRSALGTQSAPPNQVITGLSLLLTIYVMFPTGLAMYESAQSEIGQSPPDALVSPQAAEYLYNIMVAAREPLRNFLELNTQLPTLDAYFQMAKGVMPPQYAETLTRHDFLVLMPAYITSQLKTAFEVGVLIYLPFFVIDLVVSNILLAMGMMMLSPLTIALPLKLLLLVLVDGWTTLLQGLVSAYKQPVFGG